MQAPMFVRPLTEAERATLTAAVRSGDGFTRRRSQIILASARHLHVPAIADTLGCNAQTVRNALRAFAAHGAASLSKRSCRPRRTHPAFDAAGADQLRDLLHRSPRLFGKPTSMWTLDLAADVSFAEGLTAVRVSDETIRLTLRRLGVNWRRAKQWITSPDPAYARKKTVATG
ncbi:MAG: helix-turn-helix domain-containing protein [Chloroflexi bacterium]|nr:helix-turn-helix domain-containing protein [Chloroflexota bacterium]